MFESPTKAADVYAFGSTIFAVCFQLPFSCSRFPDFGLSDLTDSHRSASVSQENTQCEPGDHDA
jgi:hypothetical protein